MQRLATNGGETPRIVHVGTTMTGSDPYAGYLARRLPTARYASLDEDLAGPPAPIDGRHPLPTPVAFAAVLSRLGVAAGTPTIAYDDRNGAFAARLVWMLRIIGQPAALLDGGLDAWSGPLASGPPAQADHTDWPPIDWPAGAIANADDVAAHITRGGVVIDSRDPQRYAGEVEPIDAVAGHIPGAINVPFVDNIADDRWRDAADLADRFARAAHDPHTIVYCGSGVTACHNALAVEAAGFGLPRVFVGSWSGWSTDPDRLVATGPDRR